MNYVKYIHTDMIWINFSEDTRKAESYLLHKRYLFKKKRFNSISDFITSVKLYHQFREQENQQSTLHLPS